MRSDTLLPSALLALIVMALLVSAIAPYDRTTWWMETAPVFIALPILIGSHRRFPLTSLLYQLIALHALILILGGAYTYARVPVGYWLEDYFSLTRNPYDRIGHFFQGLVPTLGAREILIRQGFVQARRMANFLALCVAMTVSACYELVEWGAALALGQGADAFLGMQGDSWDTQEDMFMALVGACAAISVFARWQNRQMALRWG